MVGHGRVLDERLVRVADVAGKDDGLGLGARLGDADGDGRAAQQVADVGKAGFDLAARVVKQRLPRAVGAGYELFHDLFGVLDGIVGLGHLGAAALGLAVFPLGFLLLDMGGVAQHDVAQVHRGVGGVDRPAVAGLVQVRDAARVVDVRMREQQRLIGAGGVGQVGVFVDVAPLLHTAVDEQAVARRFQLGTAAGHFARRAQKSQFHTGSLRVSSENVRGCGPRRRWALRAG